MSRPAAAEHTDGHDPQRLMVYAAEDSVIDQIGRTFRRWTEVEAWVEALLTSRAYQDRFPDAPLDVTLERRSRGARASLALPDHRTMLIRDGSWNAVTVLHELAHLVADDAEPHGPVFAAVELTLVRDHCSFDDFVALRTAFASHGVRIAELAG